jgi:hypothetical protein
MFFIKIQLFVTAKSDQDPDRNRIRVKVKICTRIRDPKKAEKDHKFYQKKKKALSLRISLAHHHQDTKAVKH